MYFQEDQRKQIENKLEEKAKEEKEEIIQERRQLFQERRQTQAKLQKIEQKIEIVETVSWFFMQNIILKQKDRQHIRNVTSTWLIIIPSGGVVLSNTGKKVEGWGGNFFVLICK